MCTKVPREGGNVLKVGIAGPGGVARVHARALRDVPGASLAAVYGHREASVERFAGEFGIPGLYRVGSLPGNGGRGDRVHAAPT